MAWIEIKDSVEKEKGSWKICLQDCIYNYDDETSEEGYRFIYKDESGKLRASRGQARIDSIADIQELMALAIKKGWIFR